MFFSRSVWNEEPIVHAAVSAAVTLNTKFSFFYAFFCCSVARNVQPYQNDLQATKLFHENNILKKRDGRMLSLEFHFFFLLA